MKDKPTENEIKNVLTSIHDAFQHDLFSKSKDELEEYWLFDFEQIKQEYKTIDMIIYVFIDRLDLYKSFCRNWEEHHNGSCCVVERVRDTYLMPKIKKFSKQIQSLPEAEGKEEG